MKTYDMSLLTKIIYDSSLQLFTFKTLQDLFEINKTSSLFKVVNRLIVSGIIIKIERNKYLLKNYSGSDFSLANFLYSPSYISFETALSYYGILSQFPYEITSATLKTTKSKNFNEKQYSYYHLKKDLYWGYQKTENYLLAEKEKALADQLYLAAKGIKIVHPEEYDLSRLEIPKFKSYLKKFPQTKKFKSLVKEIFNKIKI